MFRTGLVIAGRSELWGRDSVSQRAQAFTPTREIGTVSGSRVSPRGDLKGQMHLIVSSGYDGLSARRRDADQDKDANHYDDEFLAVLGVMG